MAQAKIVSGKAVAAQAQATAEIIKILDSTGRAIGLREEIDVLDEVRLLKIFGGENAAYFTYCLTVCHVAEIAGDKVALPNSDREFQVIIKRLGRPGLAAVMKHFTPDDEAEVGDETTGAPKLEQPGGEGADAVKKS